MVSRRKVSFMRYIDYMQSEIMREIFDEATMSYEECLFVEYDDVTDEEIADFKKDLNYLTNNLNIKDVDCIIEFGKDCITFFGDFFSTLGKKMSEREITNLRIYEDLENLKIHGCGLQIDIGVTLEKYRLDELIHFYLDRVAQGEELAIYYFVNKMIVDYEMKKRGEK